MPAKKLSPGIAALLAMLAVIPLATSSPASAQTENLLYNFGVTPQDAGVPFAGLIFDRSGNLYGTTSGGGIYGEGAVFELSAQAGGGWNEKVLHSFDNFGFGGYFPLGSVVMDGAGNLYGTTAYGGAHGAGTVFELSPIGNGNWSAAVLHQFDGNLEDGSEPEAGLTFDKAGNLYGTTIGGGSHQGGTVFELSRSPVGGWSYRVLHDFAASLNDAANPRGSLIFDAAGNLYGTTGLGGSNYIGTVFELMPHAAGTWTEKILYTFSGAGGFPEANLIFDRAGNLYGTTAAGGANEDGAVFELSPAANGTWTETVLHSFDEDGTDGYIPICGLVFDSHGNLYGTTTNGGAYQWGTVFELSPAAGGTWNETIVHNFDHTASDGFYPDAGLIVDSRGNLYGTASQGGAYGGGIVFEITP
jgi:uncharacterized repeat protein (TIGR03803 family)